MRKLFYWAFAFSLCVLMGCKDDGVRVEVVRYAINEPVFMSISEFRNSVKVTDEVVPITKRGKICFYKDYLYISSPDKGIHIVDNRNPASPRIAGFVELIGNEDLSIKDDKLYADSYVDLVWFDISDPERPELEGRVENAFRYALPTIENGYGFDYNMCYSEEARAKGVVVGWEPKEREETIYHYPSYGGDLMANDAAPGASMQGVNGSMARFSIYGKYLYTVEQNIMCVFDLSGDKPVLTTNDIWLQRDVETLFNYKDKMFMGTPTGMLIYSLEDPLAPKYRSSVSHVFGCDPVVVEDDLAYVTVHSGNTCGQNTNELMLIDVSDVDQPNLLVTYGMKCPKGLGIDNGTLFLCDEGLKVFNAKDPMTLLANQLVHYAGMEGYDVIPFRNTLMMIADDGLYQYDYSNLQAISQLSKLPMGE